MDPLRVDTIWYLNVGWADKKIINFSIILGCTANTSTTQKLPHVPTTSLRPKVIRKTTSSTLSRPRSSNSKESKLTIKNSMPSSLNSVKNTNSSSRTRTAPKKSRGISILTQNQKRHWQEHHPGPPGINWPSQSQSPESLPPHRRTHQIEHPQEKNERCPTQWGSTNHNGDQDYRQQKSKNQWIEQKFGHYSIPLSI